VVEFRDAERERRREEETGRGVLTPM